MKQRKKNEEKESTKKIRYKFVKNQSNYDEQEDRNLTFISERLIQDLVNNEFLCIVFFVAISIPHQQKSQLKLSTDVFSESLKKFNFSFFDNLGLL